MQSVWWSLAPTPSLPCVVCVNDYETAFLSCGSSPAASEMVRVESTRLNWWRLEQTSPARLLSTRAITWLACFQFSATRSNRTSPPRRRRLRREPPRQRLEQLFPTQFRGIGKTLAHGQG